MARSRTTPRNTHGPSSPRKRGPSLSEGDVNLSPRRKRWQAKNLGPKSRKLLAEDARHFLRQSLSTPCLNALQSASGIWLEHL